MRVLILITLVLQTLFAFASPPPRDVYTTTSGGSWINALNWDLGVPDNDQTDGNDDIIITHHITLTDDLSVKSGTNITIEGCDTLHVTGNVSFNNGSSIIVEDCAVLIIDGNVTNNNNSKNIIINGTIIIGGNYDGGTGSELSGTGEMDIEGTVTTDGDGTVFGTDTDCTVDGTCDNEDGCNLDCGDPLPIELAFFSGEVYENSIRLNWLSLSETNNAYYIIYKYFDGFWVIIGEIDGAGNSSIPINYSFIDSIPNIGSNYYKLSQVDFDGHYEEFNTINVQYINLTHDRDILVHPNPTKKGEIFNIELIGFGNDKVLIVVLDVLGNVYYEKVVVAIKESVIVLETSKLSPGTYLVVGSNNHNLYKKKVVVR